MSNQISEQGRIAIGSGCLALIFSCAAVSQLNTQVIHRSATIKAAEDVNHYDTHRKLYGHRGAILASDGTALAQDQYIYELNIDFRKIPPVDAFFVDLSAATGIPATEFAALSSEAAKASKDKKFSRDWHRPITAAQADLVDSVRVRWRASGVSAARRARRRYPLGELASGVTGVFRKEALTPTKPKTATATTASGKKKSKALDLATGLEASLNTKLKGTDVVRVGFTDRVGAFLPMRTAEGQADPVDGKDVTLTIDRDLQSLAASAVRRTVDKFHAENGAAIVMDPKSGDILALATWPAYAPYAPDGTESDLTSKSWYNVAVRGVLEPGSTFKVLTLAMAFDRGVVNENTITTCNGAYKPSDNSIIHCDSHHGVRAHGPVMPREAIAKSCNVSAAQWARLIGVDPFEEYIEKLGLTKSTKVGFALENHGDYDHNKWAWKIRLANMGFGQSLTATPLEMADSFCALANDGVRIPPRLIKKIGNEVQPKREGVRVFSKTACEKVLNCMQGVIDDPHGTGRSQKIPGYELAGKTGTAQKGNNSKNGYVSNFVGMVPAHSPKAVILVMINKPKGGIFYGNDVAGPVFRQIAQGVIRHYAIAPTRPVSSAVASTPALDSE